MYLTYAFQDGVSWTVLPKDSFDLSVPRSEGLLTMELHILASYDLSGRVLDAFKVSV
jgi:hypothetical protein